MPAHKFMRIIKYIHGWVHTLSCISCIHGALGEDGEYTMIGRKEMVGI